MRARSSRASTGAWRAAWAVSAVLVALPAAAQAPTADAAASMAAAQTAEREARPAEALADYRAVMQSAPGSRLASRARARVEWLEARSDDELRPLAALLAFQHRDPSERTASVVAAFEETTDAMPPCLVRGEARLAVAGDWSRLGETERALRAWEAALADPSVPASDRDLVRESMARVRMESGDLEGALGQLEDDGLSRLTLHHVLARRIRAATWVPVSIAIVVSFLLAVVVATARSGRSREALRSLATPLRVAIALVLGAGPYAIVAWWGDESVGAFEAFAPVAVAVLLLAFLAAEVLPSARARAGMGALAVLATVAAAYASVALYGEALPFA